MKKATLFTSITLISMSVGLTVAFILLIADAQLEISQIALFTLGIPLNIVLLGIILLPVVNLLSQLTSSLEAINQDKEGQNLDELPLGILSGLVRQANILIGNQREFQAARGRLYEQISEVAALEERKRLARDLHDSIKQQVFSINISAAAAHAHLDNNPIAARTALVDVKQSAQEAMVEMRALLQQLAPAPLEKLGLIEALREQAEALSYRTGAKVETTFGALPNDETFPIGTQEALFRMAQEALSNIARHARAKHIQLSLKQTDNRLITLEIIDDGQGFDLETVKRGMGLNNIERRVAEVTGAMLNVVSAPNQGTHLSVAIPLYNPEADESLQKEREDDYREHYNNTIKFYWGFIASFGLMLFMLSLALRVLIQRSSVFVFGFAVVSLIIAIPLLIWSLRRYIQQRKILLEILPHQHSMLYFFKNRLHQGAWIGWFSLIQFVVPLMILVPEFNQTIIHSFALLGLIMMCVHLVFVAWVRYRELAQLHPVSREDKLKEFSSSILYGWVVVGFLTISFFLPNMLNLEVDPLFQLPISNVSQWERLVFFSLIMMYVAYHVVASYLYWSYQQKEKMSL